jgi:hypothetical protein
MNEKTRWSEGQVSDDSRHIKTSAFYWTQDSVSYMNKDEGSEVNHCCQILQTFQPV